MMLLAVIGLSMVSHAQILVATLQHGDSLRVFYNANAFVDAYNAAVAGDVITLSEGSFTTCTINKDSLTIRGTGIDKTFLTGDFSLGEYRNPAVSNITMEGIFCTQTVKQYGNVKVNYMNIKFRNYYGEKAHDLALNITGQFTNCILEEYQPNCGQWATATFINCIVKKVYDYNNPLNSFVNCIVMAEDFYTHLKKSSFHNSILIYTGTNRNITFGHLHEFATARNCIGIKENGVGGDLFDHCVNQNSRMADRSIFSNFGLDALDPERYRLTDSAQAAYLGADGTQVGLYGGFCPYSNASAYPLISRMNVANQTTADGKLSVDIQVGYRQESESEDNE